MRGSSIVGPRHRGISDLDFVTQPIGFLETVSTAPLNLASDKRIWGSLNNWSVNRWPERYKEIYQLKY